MVFDSKSMYAHALYITEKYASKPAYIANYLEEILHNNTSPDAEDTYIEKIREIIKDNSEKAAAGGILEKSIREAREKSAEAGKGSEVLEEALAKASKEIKFRREIEEFYLPRQLIDAIIELGQIPENSIETKIGIGFVDLADYSYLSKFLSPMENQTVLNGLFSAFNWVLIKKSGYLNKIEGDSIMFHFGGLTDPIVRHMKEEDAVKHIAHELFYTCVELQRICFLFNQADESFFDESVDPETISAVRKAFDIISNLRSGSEFAYSINALFQIRIRIGANVGDVTIGNFGPAGAKQWDVIGMPVIEAKRMESTAPIGGLRISKKFFDILTDIGVVEDYFNQFKLEAQTRMGYFKDISIDELFQYKKVLLKDKKNAVFESYSVQVNPSLPEALSDQVKLLLNKGEAGFDKIVELLEYYRGNKFVINAIESVFIQKGVNLRKEEILKTMYPAKYRLFLEKLDSDTELVKKFIKITYSLYELFCKLGMYQDRVNSMPGHIHTKTSNYTQDNSAASSGAAVAGTDSEDIAGSVISYFRKKKLAIYYRTYFYDMIYPTFFLTIRAALVEYGASTGSLEWEAVEELSEGFSGELSREVPGPRSEEELPSAEDELTGAAESDLEPVEELEELEEEAPVETLEELEEEAPVETLEELEEEAPVETLEELEEEAPVETLEELEEESPDEILEELAEEAPAGSLEELEQLEEETKDEIIEELEELEAEAPDEILEELEAEVHDEISDELEDLETADTVENSDLKRSAEPVDDEPDELVEELADDV
ncbi:MAG: adenylate/guanylate cyclase domain-containing protein [Spirochaetia bacterium]|jgi:class 3 adenylate cyclase|nr:adenylate/guanylate cyclase domain-containing protein [Spirochaetia bacterium]